MRLSRTQFLSDLRRDKEGNEKTGGWGESGLYPSRSDCAAAISFLGTSDQERSEPKGKIRESETLRTSSDESRRDGGTRRCHLIH